MQILKRLSSRGGDRLVHFQKLLVINRAIRRQAGLYVVDALQVILREPPGEVVFSAERLFAITLQLDFGGNDMAAHGASLSCIRGLGGIGEVSSVLSCVYQSRNSR